MNSFNKTFKRLLVSLLACVLVYYLQDYFWGVVDPIYIFIGGIVVLGALAFLYKRNEDDNEPSISDETILDDNEWDDEDTLDGPKNN